LWEKIRQLERLQLEQNKELKTTKMFRNTVKQSVRATRAIRNAHTKAELPPWALEPAFPKVDAKAAQEFKATLEASKHHAQQTSGLWGKISWFIAAPAVLATAVNTYFVEAEHARHREHLSHVSDEEWPKQYDYMNIRTKPYFWGDGDKTLFWNPVINRHIKD
jgi:cytochrome c oxidase subunit 6a